MGWTAEGTVPPGVHLVSVPIGAARDITLRALDVLAGADVLAAEDTRSLRRLMGIHGVDLGARRIVALHDHNETAAAEALVRELDRRSLAYASEAGTPLLSDPGYRLVRAAIAAGVPVHAVPGASAMLAGLVVSGLPSDRVLFAGFPPSKGAARRGWLAEAMAQEATLIVYESPHRIHDLLELVCLIDEGREAALCRELTKKFEEVRRGTARQVLAAVTDDAPRGEIVLVLGRPAPADAGDAAADAVEEVRAMVARGASLRDAVREVAARRGVRRTELYEAALRGS